MQLGSEGHKQLFCRTFLEGHVPYDAKSLPWPELAEGSEVLCLLRGVPFWTEALEAEAKAGPMIRACAEREPDPLVREALELQAMEETRHEQIIRHMVDLYGLDHGEVKFTIPDDVEEGFIDFGFEECLDSFGAFGIFALARRHALVSEEIFAIFDQVMQEEATHITFFINWFAHRQSNRGFSARVLRNPKGIWHYGKALKRIAEMVRSEDEGSGFTMTGAQAFLDNLTPGLVMNTCLEENERRLAHFDRRLLVPRLIPALARVGASALSLWPGGATDGPTVKRNDSAGGVDSSSRAA